MRTSFSLLSMLFLAAAVLGVEPGEDSIGHGRLVTAYGHLKIAMELSRGGAAQPMNKGVKEAEGMSNGDLRREMRLMADNTLAAFHATRPLARLSVITHLHAARLDLTTDRPTTLKEIREHYTDRYQKQRSEGESPSTDEDARRILAAIKEALSAL